MLEPVVLEAGRLVVAVFVAFAVAVVSVVADAAAPEAGRLVAALLEAGQLVVVAFAAAAAAAAVVVGTYDSAALGRLTVGYISLCHHYLAVGLQTFAAFVRWSRQKVAAVGDRTEQFDVACSDDEPFPPVFVAVAAVTCSDTTAAAKQAFAVTPVPDPV